MTSRSTTRSRRMFAGVFGLALIVAACGSSDGGDSGGTSATTGDTTAATAGDTTAATTGDTTPADTTGDSVVSTDAAPDTGGGAETPSGEATGEPIKIGVQNPEGDPAGSFPEYRPAMQAAADYINKELGGLGGRPIDLTFCKEAITPDDSQRCANELAADGVEIGMSTINFFGNFYPIYQGSDIPVVVVTPVTLPDFTTEGAYAIGAGGGCLGAHTGLVQFATGQLPDETGITVNKVGVPWADTPPGVVCYNDLEKKPLDVLNGTTPGDSDRAGTMPDLTYVGVPVAPASPDVTAQATEVLDAEPDVIIFSAQGADCWNMVDALGRLGWSTEQTPLVLSGSCTDFDAMKDAGDLAKGIYLQGSVNSVLAPLDGLTGQQLDNATVYQTKGPEYGISQDDLFKGFASQGFSAIMNLWQVANTVDGDVTGQSISEALAATDGTMPTFGGPNLNCSGAPAPYTAVCSSEVSVDQWDGTQLNNIVPEMTGIGLVAGTELEPGS